MPIDPLDKSTIISIFPLQIVESKPGIYPGRFAIPPSKGEPSLLVVGQSVYHVDVGENRPQLEVVTNSADIAQSVVNDFVSAQIALTETARPGVSWVRGVNTLSEVKTKHAALLARMKEEQKVWYLTLVQMADDDWGRYRRHSAVSDIQRLAAQDLGYVDKPWLIIPERLASATCPACGTGVAPAVVVCPSCRCILKLEEYKKLTFVA